MLTLKESMNIDHVVSAPVQPVEAPTVAAFDQNVTSQAMPASYQMTAPLNEAELTMLLMASPLYQKLEKMKKTVAAGGIRSAGQKKQTG